VNIHAHHLLDSARAQQLADPRQPEALGRRGAVLAGVGEVRQQRGDPLGASSAQRVRNERQPLEVARRRRDRPDHNAAAALDALGHFDVKLAVGEPPDGGARKRSMA